MQNQEELIKELRRRLENAQRELDSASRLLQALGNESENTGFTQRYPLTSDPADFDRKKPVAVSLPDGTIVTCTGAWKIMVERVLCEAMTHPEYVRKMRSLCGKLTGKKRVYVDAVSTGMVSPVEVADGIFVELHMSMRALLGLLISILTQLGIPADKVIVEVSNR